LNIFISIYDVVYQILNKNLLIKHFLYILIRNNDYTTTSFQGIPSKQNLTLMQVYAGPAKNTKGLLSGQFLTNQVISTIVWDQKDTDFSNKSFHKMDII
jgi:hypothetical protein